MSAVFIPTSLFETAERVYSFKLTIIFYNFWLGKANKVQKKRFGFG